MSQSYSVALYQGQVYQMFYIGISCFQQYERQYEQSYQFVGIKYYAPLISVCKYEGKHDFSV